MTELWWERVDGGPLLQGDHVVLCPLYTVERLSKEEGCPTGGRGNEVAKGKRPTLHMLASPTDPTSTTDALLAHFGDTITLPLDWVTAHVEPPRQERWRLLSPYLEHFSQSFGRFFMRVGLPADLPDFKDMAVAELG